MARELVFNDTSIEPPIATEVVALWLCDITFGLISLSAAGMVSQNIRMVRGTIEMPIGPNTTFFDAIHHMRNIKREMSEYFLSLTQKSPLVESLDERFVNQFYLSDLDKSASSKSDALLLCVVIGGILVSLPASEYDKALLPVYYKQLSDETQIHEKISAVDNVARSSHALEIIERRHALMKDSMTVGNFWSCKKLVFPSLLFGPEVENQISMFNDAIVQPIFGRLADLEATAVAWKLDKSSKPSWRCNVSGESQSVKNNQKLWDARRFKGCDGNLHYFEYHAKIGSNRIHVRFDRNTFLIEVGYIGGHLPTKSDRT